MYGFMCSLRRNDYRRKPLKHRCVRRPTQTTSRCRVVIESVLEDSADTHHDHIHRGQDKSENGPQLALESVSRGVWHCVAQHFENAAQRSAKLPGRPILRPVGGPFPIYLGLGVYGHSVCPHSSSVTFIPHVICRFCSLPGLQL